MEIRTTSRFSMHAAPASRRTKPAVTAAVTLAAILILAASARAQHTAIITWTNSPDTPQTNIYRNAGACPTSAPTGLAGATHGTPGKRQVARARR